MLLFGNSRKSDYINSNNIKIINEIKDAINYVGNVAKDSITILPTYTALLKINKMKDFRRDK